jgi:rhamnose utilization protein RhaD (predicted bifunctional aldolase and dehydrogenase)
MQVPSELASELLATARYGAASVLLAQASGGNNSVKSQARDVLWVKASGKRLADVSASEGTVALRCSALKQIARDQQLCYVSTPRARREKHEEMVRLTEQVVLTPSKGRPSLETLFHALLGNVVLHLHPVYINAFACLENGHELLSEIAPDKFHWVAYAAPGWELAREICRSLEGTASLEPCRSFVLANHGFIASAENAQQVIGATEAFLSAARNFFGDISPALLTAEPIGHAQASAAASLRALYGERWGNQPVAVFPARLGVFHELDRNPECFDVPGPLVPDDVVYGCGELYRCSLTGLRDVIASFPDSPPGKLAIAVEGAGTVLVARNEPLLLAMEELLTAHVLVRMLIARRGAVRVLPASEVDYLRSMESEKYRVMVCASGAS